MYAASCRLCLCGVHEGTQRLFRACGCRGTLAHVHAECLALWLRKQGYATGVWPNPWVLAAAQRVLESATRNRDCDATRRMPLWEEHADDSGRVQKHCTLWTAEQDQGSCSGFSAGIPRTLWSSVSHTTQESRNHMNRLNLMLYAFIAEWLVVLCSPRVLLVSSCPSFVRSYWCAQRLRCELCGNMYSTECMEAVIWIWLGMETQDNACFDFRWTDPWANTAVEEGSQTPHDPRMSTVIDRVEGEKWLLLDCAYPDFADAEPRHVLVAVANAAMRMHEQLMRRVVQRTERTLLSSNIVRNHADQAARTRDELSATRLGLMDTVVDVRATRHRIGFTDPVDEQAEFHALSWAVHIAIRALVITASVAVCFLLSFICGLVTEFAFDTVADVFLHRYFHIPERCRTAVNPARSVLVGFYALVISVIVSKFLVVILSVMRNALQRVREHVRERILSALGFSSMLK